MLPTPACPERLHALRDDSPRRQGAYVLYWMTGHRRLTDNFALDRAVDWALALKQPLLILEPLRCGYAWSSPRHHSFIMDGMGDHLAACALAQVAYYPYLEPSDGEGKGLLQALASRASLVVTDDSPAFFLPRLRQAAARQLDGRLEAVDSSGVLPLRAVDRVYTTAYSFRRALHKLLPQRLGQLPWAQGLERAAALPSLDWDALGPALARWPAAQAAQLSREPAARARAIAGISLRLQTPAVALVGGPEAALARLEGFITDKLKRYPDERNDPDAHASSGLSPYLHYGHMSPHTVLRALIQREGWTPERLSATPTGQREGWWGMSPEAEAFLDELITWRELGYNMAHHAPQDLDRFESLPEWVHQTLRDHAQDPRPYTYDEDTLRQAKTHDPIWNAAQRELLQTGAMHNYMRMLWGKKIIEWVEDPRQALRVMIELNNTYALDGRDPSSYSGIFWCFGRYDRGWTERPITGKLRYMSSDATRRKLKLSGYLKRFG